MIFSFQLTKCGECLQELDNPHKKPYETLLIGRYMKSCGQYCCINTTEQYVRLDPAAEKEQSDAGCSCPVVLGSEGFYDNAWTQDKESKQSQTYNNGVMSDHKCDCERDSCQTDNETCNNVPWPLQIRIQSEHSSCTHSTKQDMTPDLSCSMKKVEIPGHKVIVSVPCSLHSKKPPLNGK